MSPRDSDDVSFGIGIPLGCGAMELGKTPQGCDIHRPSYLYTLTCKENGSYLPLPWHTLPVVYNGWIIAVGDK